MIYILCGNYILFPNLSNVDFVCRDLRQPASNPVKTEAECSSGSPPKSCTDVKSERTEDSGEQPSSVGKPMFLSKSLEAIVSHIIMIKLKSYCVYCQMLMVCSCVSQEVWRG